MIGGNYKLCFDLGDNVYAINSSAHLFFAHFYLDRIDRELNSHCIYSVSGVSDWLTSVLKEKLGENIRETTISENLCFDAIEIKEKEAYIMISGCVEREKNGKPEYCWFEERLLKISADREDVEEVFCHSGKTTTGIKSILIEGNDLYISGDKMVVKIDLKTGKPLYMTCISEEDERQIRSVMGK